MQQYSVSAPLRKLPMSTLQPVAQTLQPATLQPVAQPLQPSTLQPAACNPAALQPAALHSASLQPADAEGVGGIGRRPLNSLPKYSHDKAWSETKLRYHEQRLTIPNDFARSPGSLGLLSNGS